MNVVLSLPMQANGEINSLVSFLNKVFYGVKNECDRGKEIRLINHVSFAVSRS